MAEHDLRTAVAISRIAELGSEPPYDELLRCLENDWNIRASWDGLRRFWCIELTEEGVRLRDAERTCHRVLDSELASKPGWHIKHRCSECGEKLNDVNYCPNCGARVMGTDKGADE